MQIPAPPLESLGPEAARAGRLLGRWAHPVAGLVAITAMVSRGGAEAEARAWLPDERCRGL